MVWSGSAGHRCQRRHGNARDAPGNTGNNLIINRAQFIRQLINGDDFGALPPDNDDLIAHLYAAAYRRDIDQALIHTDMAHLRAARRVGVGLQQRRSLPDAERSST